MSDVGDSGGADVAPDVSAGVDSGDASGWEEPASVDPDSDELDPGDDPELYDWADDDDEAEPERDPTPPHGIPRPEEPRPTFSMWGTPARPATPGGRPATPSQRPGAASQRRAAPRKPARPAQRRKAPQTRKRKAAARKKKGTGSTSLVDRVIRWAQGQAAAARNPWALVRPGPLAGLGVAQVSERRFRTWQEALQHGRAGGQPRRYEPGTVTIRYGDGFGIIDVWDEDAEATLETLARTPPGQQQ